MNKTIMWISWLVLTLAIAGFFVNKIWGSGDPETLLIGESTYGHYQIELACQTCHTDAFGGTEVLQNACTQCHAEELELALDAHPKSKFTDPRNADRIETLDARYCITCHVEHQREYTHNMGVTLPTDYCYHCHQEVLEERESHKDLAFESCATAGCHNYHDNKALYESFLVDNAHQHWLEGFNKAIDTERIRAVSTLERKTAVTEVTSDYIQKISAHPSIAESHLASSHAKAGVDCGGCHVDQQKNWIEKPNEQQCQSCHTFESQTFLQGKHGMRLSGDLSAALEPISPHESDLAFKAEAEHLKHGCNSCHGAHTFDPLPAATEACLNCHNDQHSLSFIDSKHAQLTSPKSGEPLVSCASCHMPRELHKEGQLEVWAVNHNQNANLRPNEKMIRSVCMNCHGLGFAINALADPVLIKNNFQGQPKNRIPSIDWAVKRAAKQSN